MSDSKRSTDIDERWEAFGTLVFVICLQVLLAALSEVREWKLWTLPWWVWLALIGPEIALLVLLVVRDEPRDELWLGLVMFAVNAVALTGLIGSVITSHEHSGGQLLLKGVTVWTTNVAAFGVIFWQLGLGARRQGRRKRHFRFPQQEDGPTSWKPHFFDFLYVSFTNSIAFSPTDAMPHDQAGEAAHARRVGGLGHRDPARCRPGCEYLQVAPC